MTILHARNARVVAVFVGSALGLAASGRSQTPQPVARPAVVLELFTSQGCSSCPPADELLGRLGADSALRGRIVPLAFHVDYWDSLGWKDPYSSAAWSERQSDYARAFRNGRIYTPQMVFAGRSECVGSEESTVRARIEAAGHQMVGAIDVRLGSGPAGEQVTISAAPPQDYAGELAVMLARYSCRIPPRTRFLAAGRSIYRSIWQSNPGSERRSGGKTGGARVKIRPCLRTTRVIRATRAMRRHDS